MCLTIPGRIVAIEGSEPSTRRAQVDFGEVERTASLIYTPDAVVGDFVIVQAGFATRRLGEAEAREALEYHRQLDELSRSNGPAARETARPPSAPT
jgi:hydrogenase expression/formation protein HypC